MESYHERFRLEGYLVSRVIKDSDLVERLPVVIESFRQRIYSSVKILPSDIALKEEPFIPDPSSHLVYVKYNPENPQARGEKSVARMVEIQNIHGEIFYPNTGNI